MIHRQRLAAEEGGVSEGDLRYAGCDSDGTCRLRHCGEHRPKLEPGAGGIQKVREDILIVETASVDADVAGIEESQSTDSADAADATVLNGVAEWTFHLEQRDVPYLLTIRHQDNTIDKELILDGKHYSEPILAYGDAVEEMMELNLEEYKLFGFVPGIDWLMLAPWMMGYLIIVLPLSFILKPVLRIY